MASWLKVAEDLLEVVDRRAKLVASELVDEQSDSHPSASNGQEVKARRIKSKEKGQSRKSSTDSTNRLNFEEHKSVQLSAPDVKINRPEAYTSETLEDETNHTEEVSDERLFDTNKDTMISDITSSGVAHTGKSGTDTDTVAAVPSSSAKANVINTNSEDVLESSSALMEKQSETTIGDYPADANPNISTVDEATSLKVDQTSPESETVEEDAISNGQGNESGALPEPSPNLNKSREHKTGSAPVKVQDQLDEAQGLLKTAVSTGQSKEARLSSLSLY